jgi:hypothetical protein
MNKHSHDHGSEHNRPHHQHVSYWKRAHTDWRFWVGVLLMLAAMITYVMSLDLAWRPRNQPKQPPAAQVGK